MTKTVARIERNPRKDATRSYDLVVVGGGIYGVCMALVASQSGLRTLLCEREDFGGATSFNSLRIVHGGLRYLQSLDFRRFFESLLERRWFLRHFPELVRPLQCLMPLYGEGFHSRPVLRTAMKLNDLLSCRRNRGVGSSHHLSPGKLLTAEQVERAFPLVDRKGLHGAALWYDASMTDSQRLVITILKWACQLGTSALNYFEARELILNKGKVDGVVAVDRETGESYKFRSRTVVNTAGPWCRTVAARFDRDYEQLFRKSIGWNVLFNKKALSDCALAITPRQPRAQTYFIHPWKDLLLAGTVHEPWSGKTADPMPESASVLQFLNTLNQSIPGLNLDAKDILHVSAGLLPARDSNTSWPTHREVILDHGSSGGPEGLYSISGVKFTTARLVAEKTLHRVLPSLPKSVRTQRAPSLPSGVPLVLNADLDVKGDRDPTWKSRIAQIIEEESVRHLDDLILRRTTVGAQPEKAMALATEVCQLFPWDDERCSVEIERLRRYFEHRRLTQPN